jgi:cellulose synthase (UDP-forming)
MRRHGIRATKAGDAGALQPTTTFWHRAVLVGLAVGGTYSLLFFADYWVHSSSEQRSLAWFLVLTFTIFWKPIRSLYYWWLFLWIGEPKARTGDSADSPACARVDVVTTSMPGEPLEMLERNLTALGRLQGLHRAYLLDGGNDPLLRARCVALGVEHIDCRGIEGAKAGKINHCLKQHSSAEFLVVLDPDHIPRHDFIQRVLPHFEDGRVGFVQVVQAYYNLRDNWIAWAAAEQTFGFYGPTMMGLHGLGIPTAIGANCTFRRAALDSIGGHAVHLAEDALTSMRLHAQGWRSVYLPWRGSSGLVPTDLSAFWKQQLKWAAGMTYLLTQEYPKLFFRFSALARLHYFVAGTHYMAGVVAALNLLLPPIFLFFHVEAVSIPLQGFLLHCLPYLAFASAIGGLAQHWYSHREERGLPFRAMLLEHATWHIYALGFVYGIIGHRIPYLPTPKGASSATPLRLVLPHWAIIALSMAAVAWVPLTYSHLDAGTELMMFFAILNSALLLPIVSANLWARLVSPRLEGTT